MRHFVSTEVTKMVEDGLKFKLLQHLNGRNTYEKWELKKLIRNSNTSF